MTENKHTPEKWVYRQARFTSDGEYDYGIFAMIDGEEFCIAETFGRVSKNICLNAEANACLIAAAFETAAERDRLKADLAEVLAIVELGKQMSGRDPISDGQRVKNIQEAAQAKLKTVNAELVAALEAIAGHEVGTTGHPSVEDCHAQMLDDARAAIPKSKE